MTSVVHDYVDGQDHTLAIFFSVLAVLNEQDKDAWCMTLWSVWQGRNNCIWENITADARSLVWAGSKYFSEWATAHGSTAQSGTTSHLSDTSSNIWRKL